MPSATHIHRLLCGKIAEAMRQDGD